MIFPSLDTVATFALDVAYLIFSVCAITGSFLFFLTILALIFAVFAARCMSHPESACMCMNGQPKLAALVALELFAASGTTVYYSGDFDPEGLWIAQRLAIFYPETFHFLNMDETSYLKCLSKEPISDTRLKQLDRITDSRLLGTVARMRIEKMAGYQEVLTLI